MAAPPAVLVMAGAARARPELRELLGDDRTAAVERLLLARAVEWGEALSDGPVDRRARRRGARRRGAARLR